MEQTPLFQLNLMLWLVWPAPTIGDVRPVFREAGFALHAIGPDLVLPLETRARTGAAGIPAKERVNPDLLLAHRPAAIFLPIECKISSFGPDVLLGDAKHQARQTAALLSLTGPYLADRFGLPSANNWRGYLLYAVGGGQEAAMQVTLNELTERLRQAHVEPTASGALGIHIREDGVYLQPAADADPPLLSFPSDRAAGLKVMRLEPGDDPRPLYLIPWDPSVGASSDEYELRAVEERVRSAVIALIGSRLDATSFNVSLDEILRAAIEVWDVWRDREATAGFRNAVRAYVRRVLAQLRRLGLMIETGQDTFAFAQITPEAAQRVRRYLSSSTFRRGEIDLTSAAVQMDFGSLAEGWL
jgi:hypothetical protein